MTDQMVGIIKRYANFLDGLNSDEDVRKLALIFHNTVEENPELKTLIDDFNESIMRTNTDGITGIRAIVNNDVVLTEKKNKIEKILIAKRIYLGIKEAMGGFVGLQSSLVTKNEEGKEVAMGYCLRFGESTDGISGINEVGMWVKNPQKELEKSTLRRREEIPTELSDEMRDLSAYEMVSRISDGILEKITKLSKENKVITWDYNSINTDDFGTDCRWEQERFRTLYTCILMACEEITRSTRRGAGNTILVSPRVAVCLQCLPEFTMAPPSTFSGSFITYIGEINSLKVYRNTKSCEDSIIVAYKGTRENDCGLVYSLSSAFSKNNETYIKGALFDDILGSENYYRYIEVKGLDSSKTEKKNNVTFDECIDVLTNNSLTNSAHGQEIRSKYRNRLEDIVTRRINGLSLKQCLASVDSVSGELRDKILEKISTFQD